MLSFFDQDKAVIVYLNMIQFICPIHTLLQSFYVCSWLLRKLSAYTVTIDMTLDLEDQNLIPGRAVQICFYTFTGMFPCPLSLVSKGFTENLIMFVKF